MKKRTFIINEVANYYVKATSEKQAEQQLLDAISLDDGAAIDCEVKDRDVYPDPENRDIVRTSAPTPIYFVRRDSSEGEEIDIFTDRNLADRWAGYIGRPMEEGYPIDKPTLRAMTRAYGKGASPNRNSRRTNKKGQPS